MSKSNLSVYTKWVKVTFQFIQSSRFPCCSAPSFKITVYWCSFINNSTVLHTGEDTIFLKLKSGIGFSLIYSNEYYETLFSYVLNTAMFFFFSLFVLTCSSFQTGSPFLTKIAFIELVYVSPSVTRLSRDFHHSQPTSSVFLSFFNISPFHIASLASLRYFSQFFFDQLKKKCYHIKIILDCIKINEYLRYLVGIRLWYTSSFSGVWYTLTH